jgi:hypothetical protein
MLDGHTVTLCVMLSAATRALHSQGFAVLRVSSTCLCASGVAVKELTCDMMHSTLQPLLRAHLATLRLATATSQSEAVCEVLDRDHCNEHVVLAQCHAHLKQQASPNLLLANDCTLLLYSCVSAGLQLHQSV